jgi:hypothetical protein
MLQDIPHFRGVYARDMLPKGMFKEESDVIYSGAVSSEDKHWLAY